MLKQLKYKTTFNKILFYFILFQTSFNDDYNDDNQWDTDDEDESDEKPKTTDDSQVLIELSSPIEQNPSPPDVILLSPPEISPPPVSSCSKTTIAQKAPLKFIIKRLNQPTTTSTKVKYRFHTIATSPSPLLI